MGRRRFRGGRKLERGAQDQASVAKCRTERDPELMPSARGRVGESWAGALATATPVWHVRVAGAGVCPLASWVALGISGLGSVVAKWALWMPRRV